MQRRSSRLLVTLALTLAFLGNVVTAAYAGTTGVLSGRVVDTQTQAPITGAKVVVASPSGASTTTTDKNGSFTFLSLQPDTYALTVSQSGYDIAQLNGITISADQAVTYNVTLARSLQQIGRVQSRAAGSLIQPGVSSDVYSVNAR